MPKPGPTDTVPAMLTPGEIVMNREAVNLVGGDKLMKANQAGLKMRNSVQGYQDGGSVSGIYRNGNSFSDKQSIGDAPFSVSSAPKLNTGIPNIETPKPVEFDNSYNTAKQIMGDNGSQSAIGAAVKPVYDTSTINNLDTGFAGSVTPLKNNPLGASQLQGFQDGGKVKGGILAMRSTTGQTDADRQAKMFQNSMPSQVGNISFLENTDLQGFANGGSVEDDTSPHSITELQKPVPAGAISNYASEYKGLPVVPAIGKAMSDFGNAYSQGAKEFGEHYTQGAKGVYNALVTKPNQSFKNLLYGEDSQTPAEKLFGSSPTPVKSSVPIAASTPAQEVAPIVSAPVKPATNTQPASEQMLPGAHNLVNLGDKGTMTSANTAGIDRVNAMVARGGLSNPEKEARFARDAANTAAQTAKYGDGKPAQQSEMDKLQDIALNGGATGDMTPSQFGNAKRRQAAAERLLGIRGQLQQSKQQADFQNKQLEHSIEAGKSTAAYNRQKDEADRELKKQELAQKTNNVVKVIANPDLTQKVVTINPATGKEVDSEADKIQANSIRQKYMALLNDPTRDAKYKAGLQQHMAQNYPDLLNEGEPQ